VSCGGDFKVAFVGEGALGRTNEHDFMSQENC